MRDKIKLVSTATKEKNGKQVPTGYFYTVTKNKRTQPEKMEVKKFDPVVRKYVIFKESKIK